MKRIVFILSVILICKSCFGNDFAGNFWQDTINVTAVRHRGALDASLSSAMITREDIEKAGPVSLSELLTGRFGIHFLREGIWGSRDTESSTGAKVKNRGKEMKILIDGHPVSMSMFNCIINNEITTDFVEAVEVSYGTESVLYGSDGLGGVVNIITRSAEKNGMSFKALAGSDESNEIDFFSGFHRGRVKGVFSAQRKETNGHMDHSGLKDMNLFGKVDFQWTSNWKSEFYYKYYQGDWDRPEILNISRSTQKVYRNNAGMDFIRKSNNRVTQFRFYYVYGFHDFELNDGWKSEDQSFGVNITETVHHKNQTHTLGGDVRRYGANHMSADSLYSGAFKWIKDTTWAYGDEAALFYLFSYEKKDLIFTLGGRYQYFSLFDDVFAPKAGIRYQILKDYHIRIGYNRGFRQPNLIQSVFHKFAFNDALKPEEAEQSEISFGWNKNKFNGEVNFYYIDGEDKVELFFNGNKKEFVNMGSYVHKGIDFFSALHFSSLLSYEVNLSYLNPGKNTMYNPEFKMNHSITFRWNKGMVKLSSQSFYNQYASNHGKDKMKDFSTIDSRIAFQVTKRINLELNAINLADRDNYLRNGYLLNGRTILAGFSLNL